MKNFDPIKVPLENSNIVEASAGTGKTFSIGLLVLRLLLEKNIPIQKILMVTFTNAAVAELASRIRKFLKISIDYIENGEIKVDYESIKSIVDQNDFSNKLDILKTALSELDEASIQTIHSFCQESLISHALESDQSFGLELQADILEIANDAVKQYWRREITGLSAEFLKENTVLSLENFQAAVKENLGGKKMALESEVLPDFFNSKLNDFQDYISNNKNELIRRIRETKISRFGKNQQNTVIELLESLESVRSWLLYNRNNSKYIYECWEKIFPTERQMALDLDRCEKDMISSYFNRCIREVNTVLKKFLFEKNLITYDELINRMHGAVKNKSDFRNSIKDKFDAVFIDEFQDTDKLQYEIYNKLFGKDKTLFYIGDPKQSIYAWRKADLHTYFQAKNAIPAERQYEMNTNYRSTKAYVDAVESFFGIEDPFYTESDNSLNLDFISVNAIDGTSHGLNGADHKFEPLQIFDGENKEEIHEKIPVLVSELLNTEKPYTLNGKRIKSSDIGILVRLNKDGKRIKQSLSHAGIHAVTIDDAQIFSDTDEARFLAYILQAVLETSESNINKALINPFTGYSAEKTNNLDKENLLDVFRNYMNTWRESGVYPMLKEYMSDFGVYTRLMDSENPNGLRILSNLTQLLELLQEAEYKLELKPFGSYEYLVKQITESSSEDEFQQRLESDEDAVKISTIHKAKGLEYPIVIAPFLDLKAEEGKKSALAYKEDHENGEYKFYVKGLSSNEQKELALKQIEQENRRLLYVSLTRAKFHCFLFKNKAKKTALYPFVQNLSTRKFEQTEYGIVNSQGTDEKINYTNFRKPEKFELADKLYGKLSFSALSLHGTYAPKENDGSPRDYDEFIFKTIPGGTSLGTMLHYLFENIDFSGDKVHHKEELQKLLDRYYPHLKNDLTQGFLQMIDHVLDSSIEVQGNKIELRKLKNSRKRNEMEFDLKIEDLSLSTLKKLEPGPGIQVNCNMSIPAKHGLLNGLIDLFFEYEGKYYILDWKSNYLGDDLSFYKGEDNMREAMNEGNYHLQYLLYSMAAKNYLEQRLPDFDYEKDFGGAIYVYLRGARAGQSSGIYTNKPDQETIREIQEAFSMKDEIIF